MISIVIGEWIFVWHPDRKKLVKISSRLLFNVTGIEFIDKTPHSTKIRIKYCKIPTQFCILANRYKRLELSIKLL